MRFYNIYKNCEEEARKALLSLWAPGRHPMRKPLERLFAQEPLLAEPVFQSSFGWEQVRDEEWKNIFNKDFLAKMKFEDGFVPFSHQQIAWRAAIKDKKSIVVTSGTGSGKTVCFTYPVLNDLYEERMKVKAEGGDEAEPDYIQAIFLYPLNALMEDQKKSLGENCDKLGIKFGVYNGATPYFKAKRGREFKYEAMTRQDIRDKMTPQILLSNPSMLEYLVVRDGDQELLRKSKKHLRWIIIDEAHSYSGSAAVELSYQIKRILEAFEETVDDVRFACTSATIGGHDGGESLREFISTLTGKAKSELEIIDGDRRVPVIDDVDGLQHYLDDLDEQQCPLKLKAENVINLRNHINEVEGLTSKEMWETATGGTKGYTIDGTLKMIDSLCEPNFEGKALLYVRAHMFMRSINGVYACPNPDCSHNSDGPLGYMTTHSGSVCPHCNGPLLEVVQCSNCQDYMLIGEKAQGSDIIRQLENYAIDYDPFGVDNDTNNDDGLANRPMNMPKESWEEFKMRHVIKDFQHPRNNTNTSYYNIKHDGIRLKLSGVNDATDATWMVERAIGKSDHHESVCPTCGNKSERRFHPLRVPVSMLNSIIAPILLEESEFKKAGEPWGKYITFTDSRQGTAITTKRFNVEVEIVHSDSAILKDIINAYKNEQLTSVDDTIKLLQNIIDKNQNDFVLVDSIEKQIVQLRNQSNEEKNQSKPQFLKIFKDDIVDGNLYAHYEMDEKDREAHRSAYRDALLRKAIGRRTVGQNSLESNGIIKLVYPLLEKIPISKDIAVSNWNETHPSHRISQPDWQDFLKIALDFVIRFGNHIQSLSDNEARFARSSNYSSPIFAANNDDKDKNWPKVSKDDDGNVTESQSRLVLLLCAGLGISTTMALQKELPFIERLLDQAWSDLTNNVKVNDVSTSVLTKVAANGSGYDSPYYRNRGIHYEGGYYLDMSFDSTNVQVAQPDRVWYCPVTRRCVDTLFKGYSPAIGSGRGFLNPTYVSKYLVQKEGEDKSFEVPKLRTVDQEEIKKWLEKDDKVKSMVEKGLWNDICDRIYLGVNNRTYLAAEHSAQQNKELLERYTNEFKMGTLNVLNCSTTMEMGVDIGDMDTVLMNTVPPSSANYLQRAGRAGRKNQSKAIAFTLCNGTPTSQRAFDEPMSLIRNTNTMTLVKPTRIIVQRHVNSFFFRHFINYQMNGEGIKGMFTVKDFFEMGSPTLYEAFCTFLDDSKNRVALKVMFNRCFHGDSVAQFSMIEGTKSMIRDVYKDYITDITNLEKASHAYNDKNSPLYDVNRAKGVDYQINRLQSDKLLPYLSENLFIPNANMPTGVVTFDFTDQIARDYRQKLLDQIKTIRESLPKLTGSEKTLKQDEMRKYYDRIDKIDSDHTASRDAHTALNEYAPGQTVVINERNYRVAGIQINGEFDEKTQQRYIYHCSNCGNTILSPQMEEGKTCLQCGHKFQSIIERDSNDRSFALAWSPIGFRTDQSEMSNAQEDTHKRYYEIRAELTGLNWTNSTNSGLCQMTGPDKDKGDIIYYNMGAGDGFAICRYCGRAVAEVRYASSKTLPKAFTHTNINVNGRGARGWHKALWGSDCKADAKNIKRHVVLIAEHHTIYTAMSFFADDSKTKYIKEKDHSTVYSLGVIIKRALIDILGIDEGEVNFGIKSTLDRDVLFMFDTNKGGSGYSNYLRDPMQCQKVLAHALEMLQESGCRCENKPMGACQKCLVDRQSLHHINILSKKKALKWLLQQQGIKTEVPESIKSFSPNAKSTARRIYFVLKDAMKDPEVKNVTLFVNDNEELFSPSDWSSWDEGIGNLLHAIKQNGKNVNIKVYYDAAKHRSVDELLPWISLKARLSNYQIGGVSAPKNYPTALVVDSTTGSKRYFVEDVSQLPMSNKWGEGIKSLFVDDMAAEYAAVPLPGWESLKDLLGDGGIYKEGFVHKNSTKISQLLHDAVLPVFVLSQNEENKLVSAFKDKHVEVIYSDAYINSALSVIITASFIKQMRDWLGFKINKLEIDFNLKNFKGLNEEGRRDEREEYEVELSQNFLYKDDRDEYLKNFYEETLGIKPYTPNNGGVAHHRFLQIRASNGATLEIRPDRGIASGWVTLNKVHYDKLDIVGENMDIRKKNFNTDILYYLIFKQ